MIPGGIQKRSVEKNDWIQNVWNEQEKKKKKMQKKLMNLWKKILSFCDFFVILIVDLDFDQILD